VVLAGLGEQLILEHRATDRAIFARGALTGAAWLARQSPGNYAMRDVLGLLT
jgi:4-hydroxy-tetrahydrodipicolinate reductase